MKNYKNTFLKYTAALLFVFALVLPLNMNATTDRESQDSRSSESQDSGSSESQDSGSSESQDSGSSESQDSGSSDGGSNDSIPLDGGLGILVLGAAAFGIKKLRGNKEDK